MPQDAMIDALDAVATAATELLTQLRGDLAPDGRTALADALADRMGGLRADLRLRHGLTERDASVVVARALAHVGEVGRAAAVRA